MPTIDYKAKTILVEEVLKQESIKELERASISTKIGLKRKEYADIYFHSGVLDKEALKNILNVKKVIVNSFSAKSELLKEVNTLNEKIKVIYPAIKLEYKKPKKIKKKLCDKLGIDNKKRIVFFTAKNLKANGVIEFINIIMQLNFKNMIAIIASNSKQIHNLKFQLSKFDIDDRLILFEDYENINELFLASDVFLLPTYNKNFASNILKAMYCKCAVFTTYNNSSKEIIDTFSTMETPQDGSIIFKIDALLQNRTDMKLIKNENRKIAKQYTLKKQLKKFNQIVTSL